MKSILAYSLLIALMLLPVLSYLLWHKQPGHQVNFAILDKTAQPTDEVKHTGITWILKNKNYHKSNGHLYLVGSDYLGPTPRNAGSTDFMIADLEHSRLSYIDSLAKKLNVLYCANMYGTHDNDWYPDTVVTEIPANLYEGLAYEDLYLVEQMKKHGKLIIAELGMLSPPTDKKIRRLAQQELGIKWSGWAGCYFSSLDTAVSDQIPRWAIELHKNQYRDGWNYSHGGIILIHEDGKIIILEDTKELARAVPTISATRYCRQQYSTTGSVHFPYWFEISQPIGEGMTTIANFRIHTSPVGDSLLKTHNIPSQFPAVIEYKGSYWMHYYAGDFSTQSIGQATASFYGIEKIGAFLYDGHENSGEKFFWTFYRPLLGNVMRDYMQQTLYLQSDSLVINTALL